MATLRAINSNEPTTNASAVRIDMKVEVVIIPVSDVDRAKEFYAKLGWRLDADFAAGNDWRGVQFTSILSGDLRRWWSIQPLSKRGEPLAHR